MKVYNTVGSLTYIKERLAWNKINDFHSVNELLSFLDNYAAIREKIISEQKELTKEERNNLAIEIAKLDEEIATQNNLLRQRLTDRIENLKQHIDNLVQSEKSYIQEITYSFRAVYNMLKVQWLKLSFERTIKKALIEQVNIVDDKRKRLQYLDSNLEKVAEERCGVALQELDRKKKVIDQIKTFIYGAKGEQMVVNALAPLSDDYTLINDFTYTFNNGLKSKKDRLYIKSIQIDHLLISTAGIFIIETKNWSSDSLENSSLRSPVEQVKRAQVALSHLVTPMANLRFSKHHWGDRKIPIRNLVVLINQKPREEFDHVEILTLNELCNYVTHFKPTLSTEETLIITQFLKSIRKQEVENVKSFLLL